MSDQVRAIIAAALSLVVIIGWTYLYKPPVPPPSIAPPRSAIAQNALPGSASGTSAAGTAAAATGKTAASASAAPSVPPAVDTAEKTIVVESDLYRVELSNRGAVVRSWQLKKYTDESEPPHTLDLVHPDVAQQTGGWPLQLEIASPQLETAANQSLYLTTTPGTAVSGAATSLIAPAEVDFNWSDGQSEVTKKLKFDRSYIVQIETSVRQNGVPVNHSIAWRGGFGDFTAFLTRGVLPTTVFSGVGGKTTILTTKNLGDPNQHANPALVPGTFDSVGVSDLFFAAAFIPKEPPAGQPVPATLTLSARQTTRNVTVNGSATTEILPEMAAGSADGPPLDLRLFVGPKELDTLKAIRPPLNSLVQYGWLAVISEPLFYVLRWLHQYVPNWGWAIVIITIAINMLLYPLKVKSWRSMQKMQKVGPEIKQIQDRYKKYSVRDPRKAEMNKEVMAVYSREGINPMGSCVPQLAQMPIWFGLYRMLNVTIELRHAPWILWVHDLSGRDPYFILTISMAALMFITQKMTPMPSTDPSQQRMMALMPLIFGGMFIFFPVSSGLVLYFFVQQVVAIGQQWHLNRTSPLKALVVRSKGKAARSPA